MAEKDKFVIIDEKPKRGHEKRRELPPPRMWKILFIVLGSVLLLGSASYAALCVLRSDFCAYSSHPTSLELTATHIVWAVNPITLTQVMQTQERLETAAAISIQQTSPAATQAALGTQQAQLVGTVTPWLTPCLLIGVMESLPDVAQAAQESLDLANLENVTVDVQHTHGYLNDDGSECVPGSSDVSFYIVLQVDQLIDTETLMGFVMTIFDSLNALSVEMLPTPRRFLDVTFTSGSETRHVYSWFDRIIAGRERGLTGTALLEALGGWR
jgi:hypothetical protein